MGSNPVAVTIVLMFVLFTFCLICQPVQNLVLRPLNASVMLQSKITNFIALIVVNVFLLFMFMFTTVAFHVLVIIFVLSIHMVCQCI